MHVPKRVELRVGDLVVRDDDEVDVAVLVGVAERERALEVRAAEVVAEDRADALDEFAEDGIQLRIISRPARHAPIFA